MSKTTLKTVGRVYSLTNEHMQVVLMDYGATVTHLRVPDRNGIFADVLQGFDTPLEYLNPHPHFNCIVGRYSNRMTNARFKMDGVEYGLEANIPPHHLHGGSRGFANRLWDSQQIDNGVEFRLVSPDGDAGYPGQLKVLARYTLNEQVLELNIEGTTNHPTPISLTAHHYFNLSGRLDSPINTHLLKVNADNYLPVSEVLTQLGQIDTVEGTPFDFRTEREVGSSLFDMHQQVQLAHGIDHSFVVNGDGTREVASLIEPTSGRKLRVLSDQPAVQIYTTNSLNIKGKGDLLYQLHSGICLETQQFPDAPNHATYPDAVLRPGQTYRATTQFEFST